MWLGLQSEAGLAPAPCPGLPGCLTQALPAGRRIPALPRAASQEKNKYSMLTHIYGI